MFYTAAAIAIVCYACYFDDVCYFLLLLFSVGRFFLFIFCFVTLFICSYCVCLSVIREQILLLPSNEMVLISAAISTQAATLYEM